MCGLPCPSRGVSANPCMLFRLVLRGSLGRLLEVNSQSCAWADSRRPVPINSPHERVTLSERGEGAKGGGHPISLGHALVTVLP